MHLDSTSRQSWDHYFLALAKTTATRATCPRKSVGAVVVKDNYLLSTGYNGSLPGAGHCTDIGCMMQFDPVRGMEGCVRTVHAEVNAIAQAAKHGAQVDGATIYVTASPCFGCFKTIVASGIRRIVFSELYRDERIFGLADEARVELLHLP